MALKKDEIKGILYEIFSVIFYLFIMLVVTVIIMR